MIVRIRDTLKQKDRIGTKGGLAIEPLRSCSGHGCRQLWNRSDGPV